MSFTVDFKAFDNALCQIKSILPANAKKQHIWLSILDSKLTIAAAGVNGWTASAVLGAVTNDEMLVAVPLADLKNAIKPFKGKSLTFSCKGDKLSVNGLHVETHLNADGRAEFLEVLDTEFIDIMLIDGFRISRKEITDFVEDALSCVAEGEDNSTLTSLCLTMIDNHTAEFACMDGHHFFSTRMENVRFSGLELGQKYLIDTPRILSLWLNKLSKKAIGLEIRTNGSQMFFFSDEGDVLRVNLKKTDIDTTYPDYAFMCAGFNENREHKAEAGFWVSDLLSAKLRLAPYANSEQAGLYMDFNTGQLSVVDRVDDDIRNEDANWSVIPESVMKVDHYFTGSIINDAWTERFEDRIRVVNGTTFNFKTFFEFVQRMGTTRIILDFITMERPVRLRSPYGDKFFVVMPTLVMKRLLRFNDAFQTQQTDEAVA